MKTITREIIVYAYTFAHIDLETKTWVNPFTVEKLEPMGMREIQRTCVENDNAVLITSDKRAEKYSLPVEKFVEACKEHAKTANNS